MHLLRTNIWKDGVVNLQLKRFTGQALPEYAILSHTWARDDEDEISFPDVKNGVTGDKSGLTKLIAAATQAQDDGYEYIWIDTCCIDKSSSAELSEAINSMFAWYQTAAVCYAYLEDVSSDRSHFDESELCDTRWFTRGWTLQELLAPTELLFFSKHWEAIGDKRSLSTIISQITKIDHGVLTGAIPLETVSIAQRMSWAANRTTTRLEDVAYCLMGIFSVNMSMLYGEGAKAFHRLQRKIMRHSDDRSLFAWVDPVIDDKSTHGLFADHPKAFSKQGATRQYPLRKPPPHEWTSQGIRIEVDLARVEENLYVASIDCLSESTGHITLVFIYLQTVSPGKPHYARTRCAALASSTIRGNLETVYVHQDHQLRAARSRYPLEIFQLRNNNSTQHGYMVTDILSDLLTVEDVEPMSRSNWQALDWVRKDLPTSFRIWEIFDRLTVAIVFQRNTDGESLIVMLGSILQGTVGYDAIEHRPHELSFQSLKALGEKFKPVPSRAPIHLQSHLVEVDLVPCFTRGLKIFCVDIAIQPKVVGKFLLTTPPSNRD